MNLHEALGSAVPSAVDAELARESSRLLSGVQLNEGTINVALEGVGAKIPRAAAHVLLKALAEMGRGHAVATVALDEEVSTQDAAELLNVSRPFVTKLLDQKLIPSRKVGTHRRLLVRDVLTFKRRSQMESSAALDELTAQAQELGMGY